MIVVLMIKVDFANSSIAMFTPTSKTFKPQEFYFLLPVEKPEIPARIRVIAEQEKMFEKPQCHVSVVVEKSAVSIRAALAAAEAKGDEPERLKKCIIEFFNDLQFEYSLTDTFSLQEKKYDRAELDERGLSEEPEQLRRSIMQVVDMPDVIFFYRKVSELLGVTLEAPVPHITLFAWSDYELKKDRGIGISSKADFEQFNLKYL